MRRDVEAGKMAAWPAELPPPNHHIVADAKLGLHRRRAVIDADALEARELVERGFAVTV
jgi:hypothetical protein